MNPDSLSVPQGAGLGLRRAFLGPLAEQRPDSVNFLEVAPENWINLGGRYGRQFRAMTEAYPFVTHGLSLSLGGPEPIDVELVRAIKGFLDLHGIEIYTEHLSYCSDDGQLYDLLPIPFTGEAVRHVVRRIQQVQDILERPLGIENASYYAAPGQEMSELAFLQAVLTEADCGLLLDVNNIYVNSINHGYQAGDFLRQLPGERILYLHVAGHFNEAEDLIVDTHGADVIDPVWQLLEQAYQQFGVRPTLLERDFNIPPLPQLLTEVQRIQQLQQRHRQPLGQQA
ncbi:MAG: DUF692 domain-containing protein [Pseudomonadota bacterium]|nr:hypothetical protein [Pseudomonadales bacterium]MDY6921754.1 DUF692 domain-containing protein [Pseudomonadota bacterium]